MRKMEPKDTANARKLAKIAKLESLAGEAWSEYYLTMFAQKGVNLDPLLWRAQKLQEIVDAEIDSTYRRDEVLWHRLFLARNAVSVATSDAARRRALTAYEAARFDAMAYPYDDVEHSRFYAGRHF